MCLPSHAAALVDDRYGCARDNPSRFVVHIAADVAHIGLGLHQNATGQQKPQNGFQLAYRTPNVRERDKRMPVPKSHKSNGDYALDYTVVKCIIPQTSLAGDLHKASPVPISAVSSMKIE